MTKNNLKTSETTLRVGKFFLEIMNNPMDYNEMFDFFAKKAKAPVYTKEALNKYINTLRALGLEVKKHKGKYHLLNFLFQVNLNKDETDVFNDIETSILKYGTNKNIKTFYNLKKKIIKFFDTKSQNEINNYIEQVFTTEIGLKVKQFGKLCNDEQIIKISYEDEILTVEPKEILFFENNIYLECYDIKSIQDRKLSVEKIELLEQQPVKIKNLSMPNKIIFELSGKLASTYKLKEGETVLFRHSDKLLVKSENDDYEFLAKRLIRYKDCCKIKQPEEFIKYFKQYIDKILKLYQ